ncbi:MAG: glycosyl hydrolase family 17 protein [Deltaproteobacteria bacterium]|nr:glycosyl hydrolase family 17 protein [Deltaproteobacteria bacterium]
MAPDEWTGTAICYSGYREGQSPDAGIFPSYEEIREDLLLLKRHWNLIRLYDCTRHAELVLEVIRRERLDMKVLLGAWLAAEADNPGCPWGGTHAPEQLERNRQANQEELQRLARLARLHPEVVFAVAAGNEATVDWTDHLVPPERVLAYVRWLRGEVQQPITFCENYVPWQGKLAELAAELDFISVHTYPVWEFRTISDALDFTVENWKSVADRYPGKPVVITEAGWTTRSSGRGIRPDNASPALQAVYLEQLTRWSREAGVLTFVFEAFDEPWKGSADPLEPEKHWGLFTVGRRPKLAVRHLYPDIPASEVQHDA